MRKTDILKTCRKSNFVGKKIWRNALALKSERYKVYSGERSFWHYCLKLPFVYKSVPQISLNLLCSGDKRLLSEFCSKWGWFQGHNEGFLKYLGLKLKFQKGFADVRVSVTMTLISSCHWKTLVIFSLQKKIPENAFLTLIVNYCKIVQKKKLYHPKQK